MKQVSIIPVLHGAALAMGVACAQEAPAGTDTAAPAPIVVAPLAKPSASDCVQLFDKSGDKIDWSIFQARAVGIGLPPKGATGAEAAVKAREAAIVIAERNLLKTIQGVHVTGNTEVVNMELASDTIKEHVEGLLQGAIVAQETARDDGSYQVVVALPLTGAIGVAQAVGLPHEVAVTAPKDITLAEVTPPAHVNGAYTGLLIDCRGLKISPALSPVVLAPDDEAIYPRLDIPADTVVTQGVVAYFKSLASAKAADRVGAHPLIIKAKSVKKDADATWYTSPILSQSDTARILAEDARDHFLDKMAVGFLVD